MHYNIPHTIRTNFGPRSLPLAPMFRVTLTTSELHELASSVQRQAVEAEREGQDALAQRLYWRAAALREAAR